MQNRWIFTLPVRQNSCQIYILSAHFLLVHLLQTKRALKSSYKQNAATSVWAKEFNKRHLHVVMKNNIICAQLTLDTVSDCHKNPENFIYTCTCMWNCEYLCDTCNYDKNPYILNVIWLCRGRTVFWITNQILKLY